MVAFCTGLTRSLDLLDIQEHGEVPGVPFLPFAPAAVALEQSDLARGSAMRWPRWSLSRLRPTPCAAAARRAAMRGRDDCAHLLQPEEPLARPPVLNSSASPPQGVRVGVRGYKSLLFRNKGPLTLSLSPLRGARGPERQPLSGRVLQEDQKELRQGDLASGVAWCLLPVDMRGQPSYICLTRRVSWRAQQFRRKDRW